MATAQTMAFVTLLLGTALLAINLRSEHEPLFKLGLKSNIPLLVWSIAIVAFALIAVLLPSAHALFKTVALNGFQWLVVLLLAGAGTLWIEARKLLRSLLDDAGSPVTCGGKPSLPNLQT